MTEVIELSSAATKLRGLLGASSTNIARMNSAKSEVLARYQPMFHPGALADLSAGDFHGFLIEKNNQHWQGLHRKGPSICRDMARLRRALGILLDESRPVERRLDLLESGQPDAVRDLGRAVLTAILLIAHPNKYGVWNSISDGALKTLGVRPELPASLSLGERYKAINSVLLKLAEAIPTDLWTLDALFTKVGGEQVEPDEPAAQGVGINVERLVQRVRTRYPDWSGFSHPRFVEEEVAYKRAAVAKASDLLPEGTLRELLAAGNYQDIVSRLDRVGKSSNLLFRGVPRAGDLGVLYSDSLDRRGFCEAMVDLLYGPGDSPDRLGRYVDYVKRSDLPNKWTFPTYFLFLVHPDTDIFIKPNAAKNFAAIVGAKDTFNKVVSGKAYRAFRGLALELHRALKVYGPSDMVDIHSFIWVCAGMRDEEPVPGETGASVVRELAGGTGPFTSTTFGLLTLLHQRPRRDLYLERKVDLERHVEDPFKAVFRAAVGRLPAPITSVMESEKNVFARFLKNDYGQGGAWDFYWGALFPRGGKRVTDAQLFLGIKHEHLEIGFALGSYATDQSDRFLRNSRRYAAVLTNTLGASLASYGLIFGDRGFFKLGADSTAVDRSVRFEEWLRDPETSGPSARLLIPADRVAGMPMEDLANTIASTWLSLFPLVLLAIKEDPLSEIGAFLGGEPETDEPMETYTVEQLLADTGFARATVEEWLRAIERKGQAILYGPPGTGKTYVAERLARHLTSGGSGFRELLQFHPSYAYEDFIQGIRPRVGAGNALAFDVVRGRFLDFCQRAAAAKGRCVMIIDEINRANLSRVFGELMYLLEYRDQDTPLAAGGQFRIPANVRIIGTMNTADRSIALVDHALRRRFAFLRLAPSYEVLESYLARFVPTFPGKSLVRLLQEVNLAIDNPHYEVGISFFLREDLEEQIGDIWRGEIEPYLEEYFFDHGSKMDDLRWARIRGRLLK